MQTENGWKFDTELISQPVLEDIISNLKEKLPELKIEQNYEALQHDESCNYNPYQDLMDEHLK